MKQLIFVFVGAIVLIFSVSATAQTFDSPPPDEPIVQTNVELPPSLSEVINLEMYATNKLIAQATIDEWDTQGNQFGKTRIKQNPTKEPERALENHRNQNLLAQLIPKAKKPPSTPVLKAQLPESTFFQRLWTWVKGNWMSAVVGLMAFLKVVVNLTPTEADNKIFAWLDALINSIIPNLKKRRRYS